MTISRLHFTTTFVLVAIGHGVLVSWLAFPQRQQVLPELPPPVQISLAPLAQETVEVAQPEPLPPPVQAPPPPPKPVVEKPPKPEPVVEAPAPEPLPEPVVEPEPIVQAEPVAQPLPLPVETVSEPEPPQPAPAVTAKAREPQPDRQASLKYEQMIRALLEKHKEYPRRAMRMRIQGEALLELTLDRNGQPQSIILAKGTGHRLLDDAVLDMVEKARPFPALPSEDPREQISLVVPVVFAPY